MQRRNLGGRLMKDGVDEMQRLSIDIEELECQVGLTGSDDRRREAGFYGA